MRAVLALLVVVAAFAMAEDGVKVMEAHEVTPADHQLGEPKKVLIQDKYKPPEVSKKPVAKIPATSSVLGNTLKDRRAKRLTTEAYGLKRKYEVGKATKDKASSELQKAMARLSKAQTTIEEQTAAKIAAKREQREWHIKLDNALIDMANARDELVAVKRQDKKAAAFVDQAKVNVQVEDAMGGSGGGSENLNRAERRRDEANEEVKSAKATLVARELAESKLQKAITAAKTNVNEKELAVETTRDTLHAADRKYAVAKFNIKEAKGKLDELTVDLAEAKAHEKHADFRMRIDHGLAHAAALVSKGDPSGDEIQIRALLDAPAEERREALGQVEDHDGLSNKGKPLVAPKGSIEALYKQKYAELPSPTASDTNPILEAEARADSAP